MNENIYTIIYKIPSNTTLLLFLIKKDKNLWELFNRDIIIKKDKMIVKELKRNEINLFSKKCKNICDKIKIIEYILKKNINNEDNNLILKNINNKKFIINGNLKNNFNSNYMFMEKNIFNFNYGVVRYGQLFLFSSTLNKLDKIYNKILKKRNTNKDKKFILVI
jgi:hypothetical protein